MEHAFFKQCNTCKGDIDFGDEYFICSVSTCQRKATNFAFCSAECWDAHVPLFRHRDAWAEQKQAPTSAPTPPPAPEKPIARTEHSEATRPRTTGEAGQEDSLPPLELQDRAGIPQDILVVASKLKNYIRARSGMNTSDGVLAALSHTLRDLCDEAIQQAYQDGRKTVMDRDF